MNGAILAAAIAAINPAFIGDWCVAINGVDTNEVSISATAFTQHFGHDDLICSLKTKVATEKEVVESDEPMLFVTPTSFGAEYMVCHAPKQAADIANIGMKFTLAPKGAIKEWSVDRQGRWHFEKTLYRCDMED